MSCRQKNGVIAALLKRIFPRGRQTIAKPAYWHEARGSSAGTEGFLDDGVQIRYAPRAASSDESPDRRDTDPRGRP